MIGYYAHHHGAGHAWRAATIAGYLAEPLTLLSTTPPADRDSFTDYVALASDADQVGNACDPTALGSLHWAPLHDRGLQARMDQIARWIHRTRPAAMVVDVSVEVANLARLLGVPVVVIAMPGDRSDAAHQWGYRLASRIVAPWPREIYDPSWLHPFADRVHYAGAFSRFTGWSATAATVPVRKGLVLVGAGGSSLEAVQVEALMARVPHIGWNVMGGSAGWRDDVWSALCEADLVVSHAGQNAVAEIAAAKRPAILVPETRPYSEQVHTAQALSRAGIAAMSPDWSGVADRLLEGFLDTPDWSRWAPDGAGAATARTISEVAAGGSG